MAELIRFDTSPIITLLIGHDAKPLPVHQAVLERDSPYFRAALSGAFKEAKEKIVRIADYGMEIVNTYVHWAYTGELVPLNSQKNHENKDRRQLKRDQNFTIKVYCFAQYVQNLKLQNLALDNIIALDMTPVSGPGYSTIHTVYDSLPESSKMRKFVLDWQLSNLPIEWLKSNLRDMPAQFTQDLALGLAQVVVDGKKPPKPTKRERCHYHEHDDKVPACM